jgi:hypothetical protein
MQQAVVVGRMELMQQVRRERQIQEMVQKVMAEQQTLLVAQVAQVL